MDERRPHSEADAQPSGIGYGYVAFQLAKALTTSTEHEDSATRERARDRVERWQTVLRNLLTQSIDYGSRVPMGGVPVWATPAVILGGFVTGELLAAGPLRDHERDLLARLPPGPPVQNGEERRLLNSYFLSDAGLAELSEGLESGCYDVSVPEEGALLVVAGLVARGHAEAARTLVEELAPYFAQLRFYPIPRPHPVRLGPTVRMQDVRDTLEDLRHVAPHSRILAQKEAVEIWAPLHDRVVSLFLETVEAGWPCRIYPADWPERARAVLAQYAELRRAHTLCGEPERAKSHMAQVRALLERSANGPAELTGRDVGRIRNILAKYLEKRGEPDSARCAEARRRQIEDVSAPMFHRIAEVVRPRLASQPQDDGLDELGAFVGEVTVAEAAATGLPAGTAVPPSILRKVERCWNATVEALVESGLITSGETIARVLPQRTSGLRALDIDDPALQRLYAAIYRAFRRRRSLLLLNLEAQVRLEELPWVAAIDRFRRASTPNREVERQALAEVALLVLTAFPHAILPNKLIQELRALAQGAKLDLPLVDELAADIFMGTFTGKFVEAARRAADLLDGTLYATYYDIDFARVRELAAPRHGGRPRWLERPSKGKAHGFARLCAARAGVELGTWRPATNGRILEQEQILTTHNLAALVVDLDLRESLRPQLGELARRCFRWICKQQQVRVYGEHTRLIRRKNAAYAWRQMVFFLALMPREEVPAFVAWAAEFFARQTASFRRRFDPILNGLAVAAAGHSPAIANALGEDVQVFLGWEERPNRSEYD